MAPNLATFLEGLLSRAGALAQGFAHYQKKLCEAAITEERIALLEVRSTMISCEKANGGIRSQPYQWLHEILLPPTDATMHDYLQSPGAEIREEQVPGPPGMFDDDPEVQGLFADVIEAESGFESSMRELDADIRAEYDWPVSFQDAVVRLGQVVLPLLEVGNPGGGTGGVDDVIGAEVMQERRSGPGGALAPAESTARIVQDRAS